MDLASLEGLAVAFYTRHGLDPSQPVQTAKLARLELGDGAVVRGVTLAGAHATTFFHEGRRCIAVRRNLTDEYARFYIGHELGHLICEREGYRENDLEKVCDALGAMLMAPMPAVRAMVRIFGTTDFEEVADEVGSTETWAALRIAEALGIPRAILTPQRVYTRGPDEFVWGPEDSLRRLARGKIGPGITCIRLHDDPRRYVLDVDELTGSR